MSSHGNLTLNGLGCFGQGASEVTTPAHPPIESIGLGLRFSTSSLPIELLFELADPLHVSRGPIAEDSTTDLDGLWRSQSPGRKPPFKRRLVYPDQYADFLRGERPHKRF